MLFQSESGIRWRALMRSALTAHCALLAFVLPAKLCAEETAVAWLQALASTSSPDGSADADQALLELHSGIAWQTLNRDALERAEVMFRDILRRDPDRPNEIAGLSAALARQGKTDEAIELLREAVDRYPRNAKLATALGQAYLNARKNGSAIIWLRRTRWLDPDMPDVRYFLGSAYLGCQSPLTALRTFCGGETSGQEMDWAQNLGIGLAFGQLGLQCEASSYFKRVLDAAEGTPLAEQALQYQRQMDDALLDSSYLHGSLKIGQRYDDNPGVIPSANAMGAALPGSRTAGNVYSGEMSYDLIRAYNYDLTAGVSLLHTSNYEAHEFDLADSGIYLASVRRGYWRCKPYQAGLRFDYDYLFVGSTDFSQRFGATSSVTFFPTDRDSTTFLCRYTLNDFLGQGIFDGTPFDLDGDRITLGIERRRQFCCRRMTVSGGYYFDHNFSEGENYDYDGHKAQMGFDWQTRLSDLHLSMLGQYYFRGYEHANSIFGVYRDDDEYLTQVALTYPLADDCNLSLAWNFDRNDSNLPINDYRHHVLDIALEYRFGAGTNNGRL